MTGVQTCPLPIFVAEHRFVSGFDRRFFALGQGLACNLRNCAEIDRVGAGEWPVDDNPLRGAPHTAECLMVDKWEHPYTREQAAYPLGKSFRPKVWPPVRRIDNAYGDRNLVCSCPPVEAYT